MARTFNGSSDVINFGNPTGLASRLNMTVAAWINLDDITATGFDDGIVCYGRGGISGWNFKVRKFFDGDEIAFTKNAVIEIPSTTINLVATTWLLVAAVVSSTQVRFHKYTPGSGLTSQNVADTNNFTGSPSEARIGCVLNSAGTDADFFDGGLAEIAKWDRQLSDDEITKLGLGMSPLFMKSELKFYSKLLGNGSIEDDTIKGFTGTITGTSQLTHPTVEYPSKPIINTLRPRIFAPGIAR